MKIEFNSIFKFRPLIVSFIMLIGLLKNYNLNITLFYLFLLFFLFGITIAFDRILFCYLILEKNYIKIKNKFFGFTTIELSKNKKCAIFDEYAIIYCFDKDHKIDINNIQKKSDQLKLKLYLKENFNCTNEI